MPKNKDMNVTLTRADILEVARSRDQSLTEEGVDMIISYMEDRLYKVIDFELPDIIARIKLREVFSHV